MPRRRSEPQSVELVIEQQSMVVSDHLKSEYLRLKAANSEQLEECPTHVPESAMLRGAVVRTPLLCWMLY